LLIHAVGQGWSFLINAASCLVVVSMLIVIRPATTAARRERLDRGHRPKGELREGLRYIRATSEVRWTIVLVAVMGLFGLNMPVILAAFADHVFTAGIGGYSLFNSLTASGAFVGAVLSARRHDTVRLRTLVASLAALGVVVMAGALAGTVWLFGAALLAVGLTTLLFLTGANSLVQMTTAPRLRGRVMGVYILVLLGGQAVGSPGVGLLIDTIGARTSMFICGGLIALVALGSGLVMARESHLTMGREAPRPLT
jgi:MFS family permease